jgi:hypothetical protein
MVIAPSGIVQPARPSRFAESQRRMKAVVARKWLPRNKNHPYKNPRHCAESRPLRNARPYFAGE